MGQSDQNNGHYGALIYVLEDLCSNFLVEINLVLHSMIAQQAQHHQTGFIALILVFLLEVFDARSH